MRKILTAAVITILLISSLSLASCSKSSFGTSENTEKAITIEAKKADKDDFISTGTLVVGEGEQITVTSGLEKGTVDIELIAVPSDQSIDELPDIDSDPVLTASVSKGDTVSGNVDPGDYMVKATVKKKATGTVDITVDPVTD